MIKGAAEFLMKWRDEETKLPKPVSYDLWEERTGIFTYSSSAVYGGLLGASRIAHNLGKLDFSKRWHKGAEEIKEAIQRFLWNPNTQRFRRSIKPEDDTIDSSLFGIWFFDVFSPSDERVRSTMKAIEDHLLKDRGGVCRYQGDMYQGNENPWIICTLWLAEYYMWLGENERAIKLFHWVADNATDTYLLAEQVDPKGKPLSVIPLTWSHAQYLIAFKQLAKQLAK
jgi:GH15 family glucan-1,4-alpha-glucosidase